MPSRSLQRRSPRYQIQLPFVHRGTPAARGVRVGWTRDLSEEGACVEVAERLPLQNPCWLRLRTDRGLIEVEGQVAWTGGATPAGDGFLHGVAFTRIAPAQRQALRDLLSTKGGAQRFEIRLPLALSVTCRRKGRARLSLLGRTSDISRGGLSLRLLQVLPPGTALEVTLHTPRGPLKTEGTVIWAEPPERRKPGELIAHGFRFTHLGWSTSLVLSVVLADSG